MRTRIKAIGHDTVEVVGSPLFEDIFSSAPRKVTFYRRGGSAVYQETKSAAPDPQVCYNLDYTGGTLQVPQTEPLVDAIRREHRDAMAIFRREQKRDRRFYP